MTLDAVVAQVDVPYQCSAVSSYQEMHYAVLALGMYAMARRAGHGGLRRFTDREKRQRRERRNHPRVRIYPDSRIPPHNPRQASSVSSFPFARMYVPAQDRYQRIPPYRLDPVNDIEPENVKRSLVAAGIILGAAALLSYGLWYLLTDSMNTSSQQNTIQKEVPVVRIYLEKERLNFSAFPLSLQ